MQESKHKLSFSHIFAQAVIKEGFTVCNEERNVDARSLLVLPVTASFARRGDSKAALSGHSFPPVSLLYVAQTCTTLIVYFVGSDALFNRNSKPSLRRIGGVTGSQGLFRALSISNRKCGREKTHSLGLLLYRPFTKDAVQKPEP